MQITIKQKNSQIVEEGDIIIDENNKAWLVSQVMGSEYKLIGLHCGNRKSDNTFKRETPLVDVMINQHISEAILVKQKDYKLELTY